MDPRYRSLLADLLACWKQLVAADLAYKAVAFVLLTPTLALLFRLLLAVSGQAVLADVDILQFLIGPVGWACAILAGGVWLAILALEQAALLGVLASSRAAGETRRTMGAVEAIVFSARHAVSVLRVTMRIVGVTLLQATPLVAVVGLLYVSLLGEHDINFYLKEKPPVFLWAVGLAAVVMAALVAVLLRLVSHWLLALPLVLFEGTPPAAALPASAERTRGHRRAVLLRVGLWLVVSSLLSTLITGVVIAVGRSAAPWFQHNLSALLFVLGGLVIAWVVAGVVANLVSTILFAVVLLDAYTGLGAEPQWDAAKGDGGRSLAYRFTRGRVAAAGVIGVLLAAVVGAWLVQTIRVDDEVVVIAHRGAAARAPENTLASIGLAIEEGADFVEIDVQETADGQIVVLHDSDFMKVAGEPLKIWDANFDDLAGIDIGSSFAPEFHAERTPLLAEVLDLCDGRAKVLIELKYYGHDQQLEQRVLDLVAERGMQSQVQYMSLKLPGVEKLKSLDPDAAAGVLLSVSAGNLKNASADFWAMNAGFVTRRVVRTAHRSGLGVYVWTVNDPVTMSRMIGRGVDGLITDDPSLARAVIERRDDLGLAESLLLELADLFGIEPKVAEQ
ncbi:Glycerophosphoryl diester phosphodiesterase [Posidoniimonas polymericola]|uniref:Glycerophosphoryl diester phosphodiesterase n=1 Tax=Posidoniimonas polymericola TaxID=2528002 RepID=A0A5C5YGB9_9BACT|nr:glycerophosphodiester phosphodiesterase family protein [Posidoniimonas polymericola]TWT74420.1 Glycerophosphoryl diester phosphodiesterase [Posidoniimonas polymericola]